VVVDIESHHSNILPWKQRYANVVISKDLSKDIRGAKVISLTGVSNVTGQDFLKRIREARRTSPKAILGVDGAQMVGHVDFDITRLGADFVAFSGHKFGAPMGIGGLIIKKELAKKLRPLNFGGEMVDSVSVDGEPTYSDVPERLEAGTLAAGAIFGLREAVSEVKFKGADLVKEAANKLKKIKGVKILAANGLILTFQIEGAHPHDVAQVLANENVMVRAGWLCAEPFLRFKGWGPVVRASFSPENNMRDVKGLVKAVSKVRRKMGLKNV
jgi:cysteine desulfurase/selenocysteine lyase